MTNKFWDISSSLEMQPWEIIRRKLDWTWFESYEITEWYTNWEIDTLLTNKVDKVEWKALSTNDYTTTEKNKLAWIESNANNYILPSDVVQDATYTKTDNNFTDILKTKLDLIASWAEVNVNADWNSVGWDSEILNKPTIPTRTSDLVNDSLLSDITAWTNITIDKTDPRNPVISSTWWGGTSTLDWLTDVTITSPSNWQALTYHTATSQWINTTPVWAWDMLESIYDQANISQQVVWITATQTITNKIIDDITNKIWADHVHIKIKNLTWSTIANWVLVKAVWYESWDEAIRVAPTTATTDVAICITHWAILHWEVWVWVNTWIATGINTSSLSINTIYYNNWAWWLTATVPASWNYQAVAIALDTKTDGSLLVEFTKPIELNNYYNKTSIDTILNDKQPLATVLTNTTASYTTTIDTRLANTSWTNTWDNAANSNTWLVHTTWNETIAWIKTFSSKVNVTYWEGIYNNTITANPLIKSDYDFSWTWFWDSTRITPWWNFVTTNAVYSANNRNGSIWNFHIAWQLETTWVIQLWHASDTTLSRVSAWVVAIEWVNIWTEWILQNSKSAAYTLVLTDAGKHIYHPSADTTARVWTIPANASVAFPIGTAITFINDTSWWTITISITTDTLVLAWAGTTWSRTLAANWIATAIKVTATRWVINWTNLT